MGPGALTHVLEAVRFTTHPDLLIGLGMRDDAAVYRLSDELALVQTVDFFAPIVDDPYTYGAIAAANALSDVYAMGGTPLTALAIAGFPAEIAPSIIQAILQGGADKVAEAGAVVVGGHTVVDKEPKYGLCVTGTVHPARITPKANAQPGDVLLLSKPLGTGVISTALKRDQVHPDHLQAAITSMLWLNRDVATLAQHLPLGSVHSATDITGYGLLGHASEIARNSGVGLQISVGALPLLPGALAYAQAGVAPGGLFRNKDYVEQDGYVRYTTTPDAGQTLLLFDPQTSGGLLLVLPPAAASELEQRSAAAGYPLWRIGEVQAGSGIEIVA